MSTEEIRQKKRELRGIFKEKRKSMRESEKAILDKEICDNILKSVSYKYADVLLVFSPTEKEVNIKEVIKKAWTDGKKTVFPKCESKGIMNFYVVETDEDLKKGSYGIYEPDTEKCKPFEAENAKHPLCITPCLCASTDGKRLGYGGGYYDRFLSKFCGISMSVVYGEFLCDDIPFDKRYDKKTDIVVTEKGVYVVEKKQKV